MLHNIIQIQNPKLLFFTLVEVLLLVKSIHQLEHLPPNQPVVRIDVDDNVVLSAILSESQVAVEQRVLAKWLSHKRHSPAHLGSALKISLRYFDSSVSRPVHHVHDYVVGIVLVPDRVIQSPNHFFSVSARQDHAEGQFLAVVSDPVLLIEAVELGF